MRMKTDRSRVKTVHLQFPLNFELLPGRVVKRFLLVVVMRFKLLLVSAGVHHVLLAISSYVLVKNSNLFISMKLPNHSLCIYVLLTKSDYERNLGKYHLKNLHPVHLSKAHYDSLTEL